MPPNPSALTEARAAGFGAALIAVGPVALTLYTPALPLMEEALSAPQAQIQLTIIVFFVGFTLAQLAYGPLSDAFGRRKISLIAIALYTVASLCALLANDIGTLITARLFQGFGAAVGTVISRAIVRDRFEGLATHRILNLMALILGIGPAISPFVGGLIVDFLGWRHVFSFMTFYGIALLWAMWLFLPETNNNRAPERARPRTILRQYRTILFDPRFLLPTLTGTLILSTFFAVSTVLPYVLINQVGLTSTVFGLSLLLQPACFTLGTVISGRVMQFMPLSRLLPFAMALLETTAISMPIIVFAFGPGIATVLGPLCVIAFASALVMPVFWSAPLTHFGHAAGTAASLFGFFQYGCGLVGSSVAALFPNPTIGAAIVPSVMILTSVFVFTFWRKHTT